MTTYSVACSVFPLLLCLLLLRIACLDAKGRAIRGESRAVVGNNVTDNDNKKPRGQDRRGFYSFPWINERRSGQDRRLLSSVIGSTAGTAPDGELRDIEPATVTRTLRDKGSAG